GGGETASAAATARLILEAVAEPRSAARIVGRQTTAPWRRDDPISIPSSILCAGALDLASAASADHPWFGPVPSTLERAFNAPPRGCQVGGSKRRRLSPSARRNG